MGTPKPTPTQIKATVDALKGSGVSCVVEMADGARMIFFDGPPQIGQPSAKKPRVNSCDKAFG